MMTVSSINATMTATLQTTPTSAQTINARAADGDYKTKGVGHEVKDADGDYASQKTTGASTPSVSSSTLAALSSFKLGG